MYTLFTDTDTDITPAQAKEYGYQLISMPYSYDGKTIYPYEDFEEFDYESFYGMLKAGTLPTTSAISIDRYINYFEPHFKEGRDILYVHFSRAMTVTFDEMDKAVKILGEKYPERKFYEIDTKGITLGSINIVLEIGDLYKAGKTPEEIIAWADREVDKFAVFFYADDLKFFKRSGRVSGLSATMGTLIGVRPIISMGSDGKMGSIGKEKGRKNAVARLVKYMEELGDDIKGHRIIVGSTGAPELSEELAEEIRKKFGDDTEILFDIANPTAGSHCGPNSAGVSFHAIHR